MRWTKINQTGLSTLLITSMFATGLFALTEIAMAQKAGCEGETISMLLSPDDAWIALVQEHVCSDGWFVTTVTGTVQLVGRDAIDAVRLGRHAEQPRHPNDIFAVDEHGRWENRPLTRWLSPKKLQITVPNKSLIGLYKGSYEGIEIIVKYEPDDPAERERWLKSLGLAPPNQTPQ